MAFAVCLATFQTRIQSAALPPGTSNNEQLFGYLNNFGQLALPVFPETFSYILRGFFIIVLSLAFGQKIPVWWRLLAALLPEFVINFSIPYPLAGSLFLNIPNPFCQLDYETGFKRISGFLNRCAACGALCHFFTHQHP